MNNKNWLELVIQSDKDHMDILLALFQDRSIGSIINQNKTSIFFPNSFKKTIETNLKY